MPDTPRTPRLVRAMHLTLQAEDNGEIRHVTVRPCEECGVEIWHDKGLFAECPECCHVNRPVGEIVEPFHADEQHPA
jgi:hypothetical protein